MVEIDIGIKKIKIISYSSNSHLKTIDLIPLNKLDIDTSKKLTRWYFNGDYKSKTHFLQILCPECSIGLFSITTTRLIKEIKTCSGEVTFICRSCSCKKNIKKVDMEKRIQIRKENWNKKTPEEIKNFSSSISEGRLRYANISTQKIENAIRAYSIENKPLSEVINILGISGKHTAIKILKKHGLIIRTPGEGRSIYMKNNPDKNPAKSTDARKKISEWLKSNPSNRGKHSKIEKEFFNKLQSTYPNTKYHPYIGNKQYDVFINNIYIEFDGIYWHGKTGNSYDFNQISNMINDENKNQLIINGNKTLYRVWSDTKFYNYTLNEIKEKAYFIIENGVVIKDERKYKNIIITHEYISSIKEKYPNDFNINIEMLISFIQIFYPFPWMVNEDKLDNIIKKIKLSDIKKLTSTIRLGNDFLKSRFKSYYMTSKGKRSNMVDAYNNPIELQKIVENRLGITYKEKWDLTPEVIRRGFISNYYSASFFNPVNAYNIYKMIASPNDTVLDMSCGFGGRMLGWHCFQNSGKYIGYEPNIETYNELIKFSKELGSNITVYNKPFEKGLEEKVDVCFSCPPYYNTEVYSNNSTQSIFGYKSFQEWIDGWLITCIKKMKKMSNKVYLVVDERIYKTIGGEVITKIKNKGSHFSGKKDNFEYLIKL